MKNGLPYELFTCLRKFLKGKSVPGEIKGVALPVEASAVSSGVLVITTITTPRLNFNLTSSFTFI
jgi:hypothetical protein